MLLYPISLYDEDPNPSYYFLFILQTKIWPNLWPSPAFILWFIFVKVSEYPTDWYLLWERGIQFISLELQLYSLLFSHESVKNYKNKKETGISTKMLLCSKKMTDAISVSIYFPKLYIIYLHYLVLSPLTGREALWHYYDITLTLMNNLKV